MYRCLIFQRSRAENASFKFVNPCRSYKSCSFVSVMRDRLLRLLILFAPNSSFSSPIVLSQGARVVFQQRSRPSQQQATRFQTSDADEDRRGVGTDRPSSRSATRRESGRQKGIARPVQYTGLWRPAIFCYVLSSFLCLTFRSCRAL